MLEFVNGTEVNVCINFVSPSIKECKIMIK